MCFYTCLPVEAVKENIEWHIKHVAEHVCPSAYNLFIDLYAAAEGMSSDELRKRLDR